MKKAQGLPLNAIVLAAIVLIVLVVIILIFSGNIGIFGSGVDETTKKSCLAQNNRDTLHQYRCSAFDATTNKPCPDGWNLHSEPSVTAATYLNVKSNFNDCRVVNRFCCTKTR